MKQLVVTGSGIKSLSHLSVEAKGCIQNADTVLYLVNEPVMAQWIEENSRDSFSLQSIYFNFENRTDAYTAITNKILSSLNENDFVCVVIYGHPSVFASPGLNAAIQAKEQGVKSTILPAISAEDCLFADLKIDPGEVGCYSVEVNDLLIYNKIFDPTSYLVVWQIGSVGNVGMPSEKVNKFGIELVIERLQQEYEPDNEVIVYEAALYPGLEPTIIKCPLSDLVNQQLSPISTLCLPPIPKKQANIEMIKKLGLEAHFGM